MHLRTVEPAPSGQPEPHDQLAAIANELRSDLLTRPATESTDPTQEDLDKMLHMLDILVARGGSPALFLERYGKLIMLAGHMVLSVKDADALVLNVCGVDHVVTTA